MATDTSTPEPSATARPKPKQENPLANLLLNVLVPVLILSYCSKEEGALALGPKWALVVALAFPVGYQIYDYLQRRKFNLFSGIGFVSVLLTGGLGLMEANAQVFAIKEAAIPLVLAALIFFSHKGKQPLVKTLLLNPDLIDLPKVEKAIAAANAQKDYERLLWTSTLLLTATMLASALLNYWLALYFLSGTEHDRTAYTEAIGKQTGWGYLVIGVPSLVMMGYSLWRLFAGLRRLTGLSMEEIMLPR